MSTEKKEKLVNIGVFLASGLNLDKDIRISKDRLNQKTIDQNMANF